MIQKKDSGIFLLVVIGFFLSQTNIHLLSHHAFSDSHDHEYCSEDHNSEGPSICQHELACEWCAFFSTHNTFEVGGFSTEFISFLPELVFWSLPSSISGLAVKLPDTRGSPLRA